MASYCHHCVGSFCGASSFLPSSSASELGSVSHSYVSDSFQDAFDGGTLGEAPAVQRCTPAVAAVKDGQPCHLGAMM